MIALVLLVIIIVFTVLTGGLADEDDTRVGGALL